MDLDEARGKPYSYLRGGVAEYLVLDALGDELPERGRGWRLIAGRYQPWPADGQGRWRSEHLPVAFGLEGLAVTVYGPDGRRQWREGEFARELARKEADLARKDAEIAALRRQLEQRGR